ncbi:protein SCO1/2 [Aromatoleum tolulyticum]|uniref:Protein SCO1/2 n=2 Tax=Aromatoleum tolulyticum TaxID=34027 RepID=A0A1N7BXC7_9RHOO|nr:protein SCO1/2 [Aromatoleum tolulyticum]
MKKGARNTKRDRRTRIMRASLIALAVTVAASMIAPGLARAHSEHAMKPQPTQLAAADAHAGHAGGHANHANHASHANDDVKLPEDVVVRFADVKLLDQNSRERSLKADVIGDRIVVMDFVYTSCTTVCPVVSAIMGEVQQKLGGRVGREVALVSLTVDPVRDTPARLRDYARSRGAGAGWSWLTGSTTAVNDTLKGLGTWTPNFEDHPVVMMVGDGRSGKWTRFYGFADPAMLVAQVESLIAARAATRE